MEYHIQLMLLKNKLYKILDMEIDTAYMAE